MLLGYRLPMKKLVIEGQENIPKDEPLLILPNHRGHGDIAVTNHAIHPLKARYMAKGKVFGYPFIGRKMETDWNTIRINEGMPSEDILLACLETFEHEKNPNLVMFGEATRVEENITRVRGLPAFAGRVACFSGVRVLPIGIWGTHVHRNLPGMSDTYVHVGEPLGPYVFEAGYDTADRTIDKIGQPDRQLLRTAQAEITSGIQDSLDKAILLSQK